MSPSDERKAFEAAIIADPLDMVVRKVFADWLEEHNEPGLAEFHRMMTEEKYKQAKAWMDRFAAKANEYESDDGTQVTYWEIMEAASDHLEDGSLTTVGGWLGFGADNQMIDSETIKQFWESYSILSSTPLPDKFLDNPFTCCT